MNTLPLIKLMLLVQKKKKKPSENEEKVTFSDDQHTPILNIVNGK